VGSNGKVEALECVRVEWAPARRPHGMQEVPAATFELKADLVLLAMGFLGPRREGLVEQAGVDPRGNVAANVDYQRGARLSRRRHASRPQDQCALD
jgi:glutamate synthase (NADPH/NADH) small chain